MPKLHVMQVAQGVVASLPEEVVSQAVGYSPLALGEHLADQVMAYEEEAKLGYYPALDFFRRETHSVDPALLDLIDEVTGLSANIASRELKRRLSRAFSNVAVHQVQATAYTMPTVRPRQNNAAERLARHYAPNEVKLELLLSSIERSADESVGKLAGHKVSRWAKDFFERFELLPPRVIGDKAS